jgi:SAM-dependent methyltransferase
LKPFLEKLSYQVMDPVDTYHPDIVGDVMQMPMEDASYDGITCIAVLEHVPRPWDAVKEMYRVLKPGGGLILYVPFLYPYHAMTGYYGDFFRYSEEAIRSLCEPFRSVEVCPVRGPAETIANLLPGRLRKICSPIGRWVDKIRPGSGKQVSGFYVLAIK